MRFVNSRKLRTRNAGHPLCELLPHCAMCQLAMCRNKTDKSAAERLADEARLKPVVVSLPPPPVPLFIRCHLSLSHSRRMLKHFVVVVDSLVARQAWLLSSKPWMASRRYRTASPETCTQLVSAEKSRQKAACIADGLGSAEAIEEEPPPLLHQRNVVMRSSSVSSRRSSVHFCPFL